MQNRKDNDQIHGVFATLQLNNFYIILYLFQSNLNDQVQLVNLVS